MLLAYIDEIGQTGAFVHPRHKRFSDSPAFGYGGFLIPEDKARDFGAYFAHSKQQLCKHEIPKGTDPNQWEKKGSDLLYALVYEERRQNLRVLGSLISKLRNLGGQLFYYAEEKPLGTPKETNCGPEEFKGREESAMRESLNRLARAADVNDESVLVLMDQINEKSRKQRLPAMYAHILGRASWHEEMRRIVEPPMHIDSQLSANIQFADWVCAMIKRAIEYQLVEDSRYAWISEARELQAAFGAFTHESKLHLWQRSIDDLHHSEVLNRERRVIARSGSLLQKEENQRMLERVRMASQKNA
ncbi:DUF3800 domain-containing protein [Corynebacterium tuberculostearicum]|uniref:DUF3800 domain-containing protein n=1 Tax=Corynebacterium tuberculostearicum TaxID=38304 RepID=UPI002934F8DE|nr:DUF3800 domain-containing protein [Corynebacterium tuberculostearicum]MDV2435692.1 DUF3800 domain-containing protein [Corynebacterium tuberculostearicum]